MTLRKFFICFDERDIQVLPIVWLPMTRVTWILDLSNSAHTQRISLRMYNRTDIKTLDHVSRGGGGLVPGFNLLEHGEDLYGKRVNQLRKNTQLHHLRSTEVMISYITSSGMLTIVFPQSFKRMQTDRAFQFPFSGFYYAVPRCFGSDNTGWAN